MTRTGSIPSSVAFKDEVELSVSCLSSLSLVLSVKILRLVSGVLPSFKSLLPCLLIILSLSLVSVSALNLCASLLILFHPCQTCDVLRRNNAKAMTPLSSDVEMRAHLFLTGGWKKMWQRIKVTKVQLIAFAFAIETLCFLH